MLAKPESIVYSSLPYIDSYTEEIYKLAGLTLAGELYMSGLKYWTVNLTSVKEKYGCSHSVLPTRSVKCCRFDWETLDYRQALTAIQQF